MDKFFNNIQKYLIYVGVLFFAVFTLPGFSSPLYVPKEIFLSVIISLVLIATFMKSIAKSEVKLSVGKFDIGVVLLTVSYIVSSFVATPNKMEAFFYPGITTFVILSGVLYFIINQFSKRGKNAVLNVIFASGIFLSLFVLFTELGVFNKIPQLPDFIKSSSFNPLGSSLQSIVYLITILPIGIVQIIKDKDITKRAFFSVASLIIVMGATLNIINVLPGKPQTPILPTWKTSWAISIETLKQSPIFGAGPANYLSAFNIYRPISYNGTNLWQVRFSSANNYYFTLITELGLLGTIAMIVLFASVYKKIMTDYKTKNWNSISLIILVLSFAFVPLAPTLIFLFMVLLATLSGSEEKSVNIASNKIPSIIVAAPVFLAIIALGVFGTRAVLAENSYKKSLDALSANKAKDTYDYMSKAVRLNPYVDRYHASLAQLDIALANSLASKKDITDADRSTVTQLIQEAISEGKATVTLNKNRSENWQVLAEIYKSILSFAEGSDQFAIQTYSQAVALDPISPNLRISLGGIYYALGDYDNAINSFQLAVVAKNDFANAHYNLAAAYAAKKEYDKAITEMNTVISLVPKDSEDFKTAETALEQIKKQKPSSAKATEGQGQLTTPEATVPSNITPPIALPSEATPPATP